MSTNTQEARDLTLAHKALEVMSRAHAPYSRFPVGAALLGRSGKTYLGVNVENASLGLSVCAERIAVFTAVTAGEKSFDAIAIATSEAAPHGGVGARHTLGELVPFPFRQFTPGA